MSKPADLRPHLIRAVDHPTAPVLERTGVNLIRVPPVRVGDTIAIHDLDSGEAFASFPKLEPRR